MNTRTLIIASVVGVVFLFAGYNLYCYFQTQAVIAAEQDRVIEERRIEKERKQAEQAAKRQAEQVRREAEQRLAEEREAAEKAAEKVRQEQARLTAEATRKAEQEAAAQIRAQKEADRFAERTAQARLVERIEDFDQEALDKIRSISPRYLLDNPGIATELINIPANTRVMGEGRRLLKDQTTNFMLFAATSQNPAFLKAALESGANINAANVEGYTPLMFAAAYNSAEIVSFLMENGADISAQAYILDFNALHIASLYNPHPDVVEALVKGGFDIESKTTTGDTALLIAAVENPNLEVVQRLVELGADKGVYLSKDGQSVHRIVEERLALRDQRIRKISDAFEAELLALLKN